ncbi:MAG: hypothetical protein EA360_00210 [Balneolaceae bacterium]|nr:MAG: hypothetical protein EA360_00210 [Balneolaceae bacterium]
MTLLLSSFLFLPAGFQDPAQNECRDSEESITFTKPDDIWSKTKDGSSFSEFWNYQIYLDNGMSLYMIFSVSDISPFSSAVSGLRISMYDLDGENFEISREYPLENLTQEQDGHKFNLNPRQDNIWFRGALPDHHEIYVNTAKDGNRFDIHLTFDNISPGVIAGDGKYTINGKEVGVITHIPFATVSGHAGINDNIKEVSGTAYMDHTFHFENTGRSLHSGYRFVHHNSPGEWEVTYFIQPKSMNEQDFIGYHLSNSGGTVTATRFGVPFGIKSFISDQRVFPSDFSLQRECHPPLRYQFRKEIDRRSVFADLNWVARNLARRVLGGEIYDHRGTGYIITDENEPKPGYVNYFIAR